MQVTQKQVADWYGVSTRAVRDWDKAGCPSITQGKTKVYDSVEVDKWKEARALEAANDGVPGLVDDEEVKTAQKRMVIAKAESAESDAVIRYVDRAKHERKVITRAMAEEAMAEIVARTDRELTTLEKYWPVKLHSCQTVAEVKAMMRRAVSEAREGISRQELNDDDPDNPDQAQ